MIGDERIMLTINLWVRCLDCHPKDSNLYLDDKLTALFCVNICDIV